MTDATWTDVGIDIPFGGTGEIDVLCPQCSGSRRQSRIKDLSVNLELLTWFCHHCGWSGGLRTSELAKHPRPERRRYERPRPIQDLATTTLWEQATTWFKRERGIPESVLLRNRIAVATEFCPVCEQDRSHILYPVYRNGEHVNTKHRCMAKHFRMEKGAERVLYGIDDVAGADTWVWVEGENDKLAMEVAGFTNVVSVPDGAPSPNTTNYASKFAFLASAEDAIMAATTHVIAVDADEAGVRLKDELIRRIGPEKCRIVAWPEGVKDANECLTTQGPWELSDLVTGARNVPVEGLVLVEDVADATRQLYDTGYDRGVDTGWVNFDRHYRPRPGLMTVVTGIAGHGKALALDTFIPTVDGWTTMGQIAVGDRVFDECGRPCTVLGVTEEMHGRDCYEITFSDQTKVVCDAEHEWLTRDDKAARSERMAKRSGRDLPRDLRPRGSDQTHLRSYPSIKRTAEIAGSVTVQNGKRMNHAVPVANRLQTPPVTLPIDPYVLGAWLGDGASDNGAITSADGEVIEQIEAAGYTVTKWAARYLYGIGGLKVQLRGLGVLGKKHVPSVYLRAGTEQRIRLMQGLLDTDGYATRDGRCEFTSTSRRLALAVHDLAASLGAIPTFATVRATIGGRDCGEKFRVSFTPTFEAFAIKRKRDWMPTHRPARIGWRQIIACHPVESVPVRCIQVDSPSHLYLCTSSMIPTHNSHFLDAVLVQLATRHGWNVAICSPENQPIERHVAGIVSTYIGMPFHDGPTMRMSRESLDAGLVWMGEHFAFVLPEQPTIEAILERVKLLVYRRGINGVVIDPWNEIEHSRPANMTETEYISAALGSMRRFARHHNVHLWIVAHPTKMKREENGAEPVPSLWDISGSAHWRNKADAGLVIWRDLKDQTKPVLVEIQKIRFAETGEIGQIEFAYDRLTGRYREV